MAKCQFCRRSDGELVAGEPFQPGDNHNCLSCERRNAYLQSDNYRTAQA